MIQQSNIIEFHRKPDLSERIHDVVTALCISLNLACIAVSLFILGWILL